VSEVSASIDKDGVKASAGEVSASIDRSGAKASAGKVEVEVKVAVNESAKRVTSESAEEAGANTPAEGSEKPTDTASDAVEKE
jgi:hypothetical protein